MKKTLTALLLMAGVAMGAAPTWNITQTDATHVTYTATWTGSFTFDDLGDAAIKDGESFTLAMSFTSASNPFVQGNALSFIAAKNGDSADLYDINGKDNMFRLYIRPNDSCLMLNINGWSYGYGEASTDSTSYTSTLPTTPSAETPVKLAFELKYVNDTDAPGGDSYFSFSSLADSQIQIDPITDNNVVRAYNFHDLTNYTGSHTNAPADLVTTISITKEGTIPEPTTATLSLLALVGLAARRRRR